MHAVRRAPGLAILSLLVVTFAWGFSFIWMKQSLLAVDRAWGRPGGAPVIAAYIAARFTLAGVLLAVLAPSSRRALGRRAWLGGGFLGATLAAGFLFQMLGLETVTPAVSAFLTSLYVVFAALLAAAGTRALPHRALVAGAALATFGAGFIGGPPQLTFGAGEWFTVACALVFAVQILATDRITKAADPLAVTLACFVCTALGGLGIGAAALSRSGAPSLGSIFALFTDRGFLVPLLFSTIFATIIAFTLMNYYQRALDPVRAAILYALEPVWAAIIAIAWGYDRPNAWLFIGGGALLAGNLVAEMSPRR